MADHHETIIIGAGPAGLSVAAALAHEGRPALLLERADGVGNAWRNHYDRLHLHTDRDHSILPHFPWPTDTPRYPSRAQVVDYLEAYAKAFELAPRFGTNVVSARPDGDGWRVEAEDGATWSADNLVVATGTNGVPHVPDWPGRESFRGTVVHSFGYRNGAPWHGMDALVVGFGNSGGEIALDLIELGARTKIAVRSPVNVIPKEVMGTPILAIGIRSQGLPAWLADLLTKPLLALTIGDIEKLGLKKLPYGPAEQIATTATIPLIDIGTLDRIREGTLHVRPGIERFTETGVVYEASPAGSDPRDEGRDPQEASQSWAGREERFDVVVLATGYRARLDRFLKLPHGNGVVDEHGKPDPKLSGRPTPVPGLYLCGFFVSPTGMFRELSIEAIRIAGAIAKKAAPTGRARARVGAR